MFAIYLKEMKQYFRSTTGYIFLAVMMLICGFIFSSGNLMSQNGDINTFFSSIFTIFLFIVPLLTMRQFSEEKKLKTLQLLFTLPLSIVSIVFGKFLATLSMFMIGLILTLIYPVILAWYGSFEFLITAGNYLGVILLVSSIAAIGLFISSLTENQVISAIVSYGVILILWLTDSLAPFVSGGILKKIMNIFSLKANFIEFTYGIFNPASIVYFISITTLFLILTITVLEDRRH